MQALKSFKLVPNFLHSDLDGVKFVLAMPVCVLRTQNILLAVLRHGRGVATI